MEQPIPTELGSPEPTPLRPVRHSGRSGSSLPVLLSSFVGREREIAAVVDLLSDPAVRLVTLTGPGGVGKTRLAIEAVSRLADTFPDDVCFASLASERDPAQVLPLMARSLGVRPVADHLLLAQLGSVLGADRAMMLLDNFEHLLDAAPALAELLSVCPGLTILVTSREPLHLSGEHEFLVPPLRLPEPGDAADPAILGGTEAVDLFVQRARQVKRDFALTADNGPAVAELCARLDGLPLGIELAAARAKLFHPHALLTRLDRRLDLLTSGPSDTLPRLRSLRGAVAWSHDLLDANEQRLFRRLAVFAGGFSLDAAEAVAQGGPDEEPIAILDGMASLVDQSLVRADVSDRKETRFTMLETVRAYALEQLEASGDATAVRERHARWCLTVAEWYWERGEEMFW
jgi:predicted ATPase